MKNHLITCVILLAGLSLTACQQGREQTDQKLDSVESPAMEQLTEADSSTIIFERTRVQGQKDTLSFRVPKVCKASINIETEGKARNIRINQFIMPDGQTDGPFGNMLTDSLKQTGTYQVVIAESLMAEDTYTGAYKVKIELK